MESTGPAPSSVYDAHPLNLQDLTSIRLIELVHDENHTSSAAETCLPGHRASSVAYKLRVVPLQDAPPYVALSYIWGSPDVTRTMFLDGKPVTIRKNLYEFLSHYSLEGSRLHIWIDALCIDQNCVEERNHQVAIMGSIYGSAEMVIAWVGLGYENELTQLSKVWEAATVEHHSRRTPYKEPQETAVAEEFLKGCLENLSRSVYWTRLWIVQEFLLNPRLSIMSGNASLSMEANAPFVNAFPFMVRFSLLGEVYPSTMYTVILERERHVGGRNRVELRQLIDKFKTFKCADIRDRVFGLLGLVEEEGLRNHPIAVDYSQPAMTLFFNLCRRERKIPRLSNRPLISLAANLRKALELPDDMRAEDGIPSQSMVAPDIFEETLVLLRELGGQEYTDLSEHLVGERHDWLLQTEGNCHTQTKRCEMCNVDGLNPL